MYICLCVYFLLLRYSVQFSRSIVSDSMRPHKLQHARPPCPSPSPGVHSDSCPSSPWCHQAISSSVVPFSSCSQSLPASVSFPMSQLFAWGMASQPNSYLFISSYPTVSYPALLWFWVNGLLLWNVLAFFIWFIWWDLVRWGHILK